VLLVELWISRPMSSPRMRPSGSVSGPTTSTSSPRWRSAAAASRPMKLAPITTARGVVFERSMIARLSCSVRSKHTWGSSAPGRASRRGSAPVASNSAP
jgi:hypothetical protein